MSIPILRTLPILILLLPLSTRGIAQYGHSMGAGEQMKMWNVKAGIFIPRQTGSVSTAMNIGIEHEHPAKEIIKNVPGNFTLSIDYAQFNSTSGMDTRNVSLIPVFVNWKMHYKIADTQGQSWFYGLGIGVYWTTDTIPEMSLNKGTQFAWNAQLGYNLNPSWFVEGRFMASEHAGDSWLIVGDVGYSF